MLEQALYKMINLKDNSFKNFKNTHFICMNIAYVYVNLCQQKKKDNK